RRGAGLDGPLDPVERVGGAVVVHGVGERVVVLREDAAEAGEEAPVLADQRREERPLGLRGRDPGDLDARERVPDDVLELHAAALVLAPVYRAFTIVETEDVLGAHGGDR